MLTGCQCVPLSLGNQVDGEFLIAGVNTCPSSSFTLTTKSTESFSFTGVNGAHCTGEFMNTNLEITATRLLPRQGPQVSWCVSVDGSEFRLHHSDINLHSIYNASFSGWDIASWPRRPRFDSWRGQFVDSIPVKFDRQEHTHKIFAGRRPISEVFQTFSSPHCV